MNTMLKKRVAIITGAGRGIGRETAILFSQEGARTVVCDMDEKCCLETAEFINHSGGACVSIVGDVTDPGFPEKVAKISLEKFGPSIDIIVNNAGYGGGDVIERTTDAFWNRMHDIHVSAPFRLIRTICPIMKNEAEKSLKAGIPPISRKIVNISSFAATDGLPKGVAYASAKAAIFGLTKSLAKELGKFNICVNSIAFGLIETRLTQPLDEANTTVIEGIHAGFPSAFRENMIRLTPLGRAGTVQEAAGAILMMASPLSDFITGQVIKVSGGL
jgi:3-oxoacyl-[acyl-carrier protein] reductase